MSQPRVVHHREPHDVYIGRPSKWGNRFVIGVDGDRDEVIEKYGSWVMDEIREGRLDPEELRGKTLGCWCAPQRCHGDILLALANVVAEWRPGDPCGACGSRNTYWGDAVDGAICGTCGACDSDE